MSFKVKPVCSLQFMHGASLLSSALQQEKAWLICSLHCFGGKTSPGEQREHHIRDLCVLSRIQDRWSCVSITESLGIIKEFERKARLGCSTMIHGESDSNIIE